jgi:hypothetical protein
MSKHVGGRGIKAPYKTTHVRVPEPVKPEVERIIQRFHEGGKVKEENVLTPLENAVVIAKGILTQKKSARISMSKLLTAIYGENVTL